MAMPSWSSVLQATVLAAVAYVLAGAPFSHLLSASRRGSHERPASGAPPAVDVSNTLAIPDANLSCPPHDYTVHVLAHGPLVLYIEGFVSADEADHLVRAR